MIKKRPKTQNYELNTKLRDHSDFIKKYYPALVSLSNTLKNKKPDFILALTRKAPRLLELMKLAGIMSHDVPIISERAIDFMPSAMLEGKKILVFDDIIILGTTMKDLLTRLTTKYNQSHFEIVCLAIDIDTTILEKEKDGRYVLKLKDRDINVDCKLPLTKEQRFIFCNEIVRAFIFLNKPYDIDFCLLYTQVNNESFLFQQSAPDKGYDVTTNYQHINGYNRHTFIPTQRYLANKILTDVFENLSLETSICKVRTYHNSKTGEITLAPMVCFSIHKTSLLKNEIFTNDLSFINDLLVSIRAHIEKDYEEKAMYRIIWYIMSYLYGLSFAIRNSNNKDATLQMVEPSRGVRQQDLQYLFGPLVSTMLLKFLEDHYSQTLSTLNQRHNWDFSDNVEQSNRSEIVKGQRSHILDNKRYEVYEKIKPYITKNIKTDDYLTNQIATIFEGLNYNIEIEEELRSKTHGFPEVGSKRLNIGFNFHQVSYILSLHGVPLTSHSEFCSTLALDYLVDAGVQIPIFYYDRTDGIFERAYRYGEDGLSALQYGHLINSIMWELFDYAHKNDKRESLPQIAFEKIGTFIREEIIELGLVDVLRHKLGPDDWEISVAPSYLRHGKVLKISEESSTEGIKPTFTEWCVKEGIVKYGKPGLSYTDDYIKRYRFVDGTVPVLNAEEKIARLAKLSILLYHIDHNVDKGRQSDYLIALATCCDYRCYLEAIREELRLFFKSKDWGLHIPLDKMIELTQNEELVLDKINDMYKLIGKPNQAAHATYHKKKLWDNMPMMLDEIDKYFKECTEMNLEYIEKLRVPYLSKIRIQHNTRVEPAVKALKERIEIFGELCINLSNLLKYLIELDVLLSTLGSNQFANKQHQQLKEELSLISNQVISWNNILTKYRCIDYGGISIQDISQIQVSNNYYTYTDTDIKNYVGLHKELLTQISNCYTDLVRIYDNNYSLNVWQREMDTLQLVPIDLRIEMEKTTFKYITWYDMKNSSAPENRERSPKAKKSINISLAQVREITQDGLFDKQERDDKCIYIDKLGNVPKYLKCIMSASAGNQIFLRIGLISASDLNQPIFSKNGIGTDIIENTQLHTLVNRLGDFGHERGLHHRLTISKEAMYTIWGNEDNFNLGDEWHIEWVLNEKNSKVHSITLKEIGKQVDCYIINCSLSERKQTTFNDYIR